MRGKNYKIPKNRAYTRHEYIHGVPQSKISKFTMGNSQGNYTRKILLISQSRVQVSHNALEALRVSVNKVLFDKVGETSYYLKLRLFPHIVLRENKMMAFAGADRLQEGMRRSFGKSMGVAAKVEPGQPIIEVLVEEKGLEAAKVALKVGLSKIPTPCAIEVTEILPQPAN